MKDFYYRQAEKQQTNKEMLINISTDTAEAYARISHAMKDVFELMPLKGHLSTIMKYIYSNFWFHLSGKSTLTFAVCSTVARATSLLLFNPFFLSFFFFLQD